MKYKILALSVAGAILGGCGSDNDNSVPGAEYEIMAFDPAIMGMKGTYSCDNGVSGDLDATSFEGISTVEEADEPAVVNSPETCAFTYNATPGAVDVSNGKDMSDVSYKFPKGLATLGTTATASPISTLIEKELDGQPYNEATGIQIMEDLGLGDLLNEGSISSVADYLRRTQDVIEDLPAEDASLVSATNAVLSDVLVVSPDAEVDEISEATVVITEAVIEEYPEYPESQDGDTVYLDLTEDEDFIADVIENPEDDVTIPEDAKKDAEPVPNPDDDTDTDTDTTGATGVTGGDGGTGG